ARPRTTAAARLAVSAATALLAVSAAAARLAVSAATALLALALLALALFPTRPLALATTARASAARLAAAAPAALAALLLLSLAAAAALLGRERDPLALGVDLEHAHGQLLADLDDLARILHELLGQLRDVDEPVVVDADVDERAERGDVGD